MAKTPAWQRKEGKNPKGGLNAKGRASAKAQGSNLKAPVKDSKGRPTRLKLALKAWGFGSKEAARAFAARHKKKKSNKA